MTKGISMFHSFEYHAVVVIDLHSGKKGAWLLALQPLDCATVCHSSL